MFIGEFTHSLDEKGRLAIPVKFRRELLRGAVVTRGLDDCLFIYTKKEWTKLAEKLSNLPLGQKDSRAFARLMLAGAMKVQVDSQGRVVIPEYLRSFAGISKKVVVAGLYSRIEVWDTNKWEAYKSTTEKDSESIAERMGELGV
ncbi:division/cell wall cluster transcriptional repressor MraZ [Patescibacteria group bacterium]